MTGSGETVSELGRVELRCASCGYGVVVSVLPSTCPMCHEAAWERVRVRRFPLLRTHRLRRRPGR